MPRTASALGLGVLCLLLTCGAAQAQSLDNKLRAQLRITLDQLHALQNAQADLQAQKTAAEKERDALKAKGGGGGGAPSAALKAELDRLRAQNAQLTQTVQQGEAELARYKDAFAQASTAIGQVRAERDQLVRQADLRTQALADCEGKNIRLLTISHEILAAYAKGGVFDSLARREPFVGTARLKLEQAAQDYGDRIYDAKFDPRAVKPPPVAPTP